MNVTKFSSTAAEVPALKLITKEDIKEFLFKKYDNPCMFGIDELLNNGCYKLQGWKYNFREELKRYIVKQYGSWNEYYAPNKTLLRKQIYGKLDEIVEAPLRK